MSQDLDDVFNQQTEGGGGAPSFAFPKELGRNNKVVPVIGSMVVGEITGLFKTVVKDIDTGEPKLDKNGNQQSQVNITLKTDLRNWEATIKPGKDEDGNELPPSADEGLRRIYAKHRMLQAIAKAVKDAGQTGAPKVGGKLAVRVKDLQWDEKNTARNPLPDYDAKYEPPTVAPQGVDDAFNEQRTETPAPAAAPAQQSAPAAGGWADEPPF